MTTHRRYYFVHDGQWDAGHDRVREELDRQCVRNWWYNNPEVLGEPFGLLEFRVTVSAEDQWRVHTRAMALARTLYAVSGKDVREIPTPFWEPLEPHTNRGYSRLL